MRCYCSFKAAFHPGTILIGDPSVMIEVTLKGKALQSLGEAPVGLGLSSLPLILLS